MFRGRRRHSMFQNAAERLFLTKCLHSSFINRAPVDRSHQEVMHRSWSFCLTSKLLHSSYTLVSDARVEVMHTAETNSIHLGLLDSPLGCIFQVSMAQSDFWEIACMIHGFQESFSVHIDPTALVCTLKEKIVENRISKDINPLNISLYKIDIPLNDVSEGDLQELVRKRERLNWSATVESYFGCRPARDKNYILAMLPGASVCPQPIPSHSGCDSDCSSSACRD